MSRAILLASSLCVSALVGCHAPVPSMDILTPYGASRVTPPATGSYGSPNNYYQGASVQRKSTSSSGTDAKSINLTPGVGTLLSDQKDQNLADAPQWRPVQLQATVLTGDQAVGTGVKHPVEQAAHQSLATRSPGHVLTPRADQPIRIAESRNRSALRDDKRLLAHDLTNGNPPARFVPPGNAVDISKLPPAQVTTSAARPSTSDGAGLKWRAK